jgi:peptide/nickel transport system substrate-binding protein
MIRPTTYVRLATAVGALSLALVAAGCGVSSTTSSGASGPLTVVSGPSGPFVPGLNPFSTTDSPGLEQVTSLVYEPLIMFNAIKPTDKPKPWLASDFAWSNEGKTLTFTIPAGRTWSDGKPLTAQDVAFTFNYIKKNPALNINGIDFQSASAPSATKAVLTFAGPGYTQLFNLGKVLIVPEHIWSSVAHPEKYSNDTPVGSGPYLLSGITSQAINFTKNPKYWRAGLPKVPQVRVVDYTSQNAAISAITAGQIDWNNVFLSNPAKQFTSQDPTHRKLWLAPAGDFFLCPNTKSGALGNATVRQALAYSIDRDKAIPEVEGDYYTPTDSVTGLRAAQTQYIPSDLTSSKLSYDPKKVRSLLKSAGYTGDTGLMKDSRGKTLKLALMLPSDYTDWMSLGTLLVNEMKAAGIDASLQGTSTNSWTSAVASGHYQLTFCGQWSSGGPYTTFNALLNSKLGAPIGSNAVSNVARWDDASTDSLLAQFRQSGDNATQTRALQGIARIIADKNPIIPLMSVSSFGSYNTTRATGFPSAQNPYQTDTIGTPFTLDVLLHLKPTS